jgi:hypothetical protein
LANTAAPEAEAVYAALGIPFSTLVFGLRQYYSLAVGNGEAADGHIDADVERKKIKEKNQ